MHILRTSVLGILFITLLVSCSTTEKTTAPTEQAEPVSVYPSWYNTSGFEADSVAYSAYHTAIAADSVKALQSAERFARIDLESRLAEMLESVREELASNGNTVVQQRDFIILLRNAHQEIVNGSEVTDTHAEAMEETDGYRAFAKSRITKADLIALLSDEFSGYDSYWKAYGESEAFKSGL